MVKVSKTKQKSNLSPFFPPVFIFFFLTSFTVLNLLLCTHTGNFFPIVNILLNGWGFNYIKKKNVYLVTFTSSINPPEIQCKKENNVFSFAWISQTNDSIGQNSISETNN